MNLTVRASLLSFCIAVGVTATVCRAGQSAPSAAAPAPAAESPEQVVMDVTRALSEGRPYVAWDALPASYQDDLTALVHAYAAKVDSELWNKGFAIIRNIAGMLRSQKQNILAMPKVRESSGFDAEQVSREWDLVVAPVLTIADSELAAVSSLEKVDVRRFLATTGVRFMQDLGRIAEFAADDADNKLAAIGRTQATLVNRDGDSAIVRIEVPGEPARTEPFVLVEGKWIPKEIADDWANGLEEARQHIAQMSPEKLQSLKPTILAVLTSIDGTVDQLAQAETPEQFEQTLQMGFFQAMGGMMKMAQAMEPEHERPE